MIWRSFLYFFLTFTFSNKVLAISPKKPSSLEKSILQQTVEIYNSIRNTHGVGKTLNMLSQKALFSETKYPKAQVVSSGIKLMGTKGVLKIVDLQKSLFNFRGQQFDLKNMSANEILKKISSQRKNGTAYLQYLVPQAEADLGFLGGAVYALGAAVVGLYCGAMMYSIPGEGGPSGKANGICAATALTWPISLPLAFIGINASSAIKGVASKVRYRITRGKKSRSEKLKGKVLSFPKRVECLADGGVKVFNADGSVEQKRWNSAWKRRHIKKACKNYPEHIVELNQKFLAIIKQKSIEPASNTDVSQ